jgi:transcriptional regulator with XRE-family HTH domain
MNPLVVPRAFVQPVCLSLVTVIHELRQKRGWSLNHVSRNSGLTRQGIRHIETGRKFPTIDSVARIAVAFDMRLSALVMAAELLLERESAPMVAGVMAQSLV